MESCKNCPDPSLRCESVYVAAPPYATAQRLHWLQPSQVDAAVLAFPTARSLSQVRENIPRIFWTILADMARSEIKLSAGHVETRPFTLYFGEQETTRTLIGRETHVQIPGGYWLCGRI